MIDKQAFLAMLHVSSWLMVDDPKRAEGSRDQTSPN